MSDSILRDKSKEFAKQIVILCRDIKQKDCTEFASDREMTKEDFCHPSVEKHAQT